MRYIVLLDHLQVELAFKDKGFKPLIDTVTEPKSCISSDAATRRELTHNLVRCDPNH